MDTPYEEFLCDLWILFVDNVNTVKDLPSQLFFNGIIMLINFRKHLYITLN